MEKKNKLFLGGLIAVLIASIVGNVYFILSKKASVNEVSENPSTLVATESKVAESNATESKTQETTNSTPKVVKKSSDKKLYSNVGPEPIFVETAYGNVKCITIGFLSKSALVDAKCTITPATKIEAVCSGTLLKIYGEFIPGKVYTVKVHKGASNSEGGVLEEDAVAMIQLDNLSPKISFAARGGFLPYNSSNIKVPFYSVNLDKATLEIRKAYNNNLHVYNDEYYKQRYVMQTLYTGDIKLKNVKNQEVYQEIELNKYLKNPSCGLYLIKLNDEELNVFVTDIGLQAVVDSNNSKALIFIRSLSNNKPLAGAKVYLNSYKNQIVASGVTGEDGSVIMDYRPEFNPKDDYASTITAIKGKDVVLMKLNRSQNYYTSSGNYFDETCPNAFIFTERGVARPGEEIECFAFIKKVKNNVPRAMKKLPFTLTMVNNFGEVVGRANVTSDNDGFVKTIFKVPATAPTGRYQLYCFLAGSKEACGVQSITIANYVPDMIKVVGKDLSSEEFLAEKEHKFSFSGNYYFGAPVVNSRCNISVLALADNQPDFWGKTWTVGCEYLNEKITNFTKTCQKTEKDVEFTYPGFTSKVYQPYKLIAQATMAQPGGRSVTGSVVKTVHPSKFYICLREDKSKVDKAFEYTLLPAVKSDYITLDKDLKIEFTLVETQWDFALVKKGNSYSREWVEKKLLLEDKTRTVIIPKGKYSINDIKSISWKLESGEYELFAKSDCGKIITAKKFYYYYGSGNERSGNPNVLTIKTNKDAVLPGEDVKLEFESSVNGEAFISLIGSALDGKKIIPVSVGKNSVNISIPRNIYTSSYHVGITVIGKKDGSFIRNFGVAQIAVDQKNNYNLKVDVKLPPEVRPQSSMPVSLTLTDNKNNPVAGKVVIYAVDSGVTALTNYKAPDIFNYFYGKHRTTVCFYDLYSQIMDELKITVDGRIGGDSAITNKISQIKNAQCAKVVSQVIDVPTSGKVNVKLNLPKHTGSLDVFAVAVSENKVGSSQNSVILREPISVKTAAPRFLSPKDIAEISVTVFNHKLTSQNFTINVKLPKVISVHSEDKTTFKGENLAPGKQQTFTFRVCAREALEYGTITTNFTMGNITVSDEQFITIRSSNVHQSISNIQVIKPGESLTIDHKKTFIGKTKGTVKISSNFAISVNSALNWLNSYPYGCLEQSCAIAFPYIGLDLLVKSKLITQEVANTNKHKVRNTVNLIKSMALSDGSFAMWPGYQKSWKEASIFAYHFLFEAINKKLISTNDVNLYKAFNFLRKIAQDSSSENRNCAAYATYCLSLMGDKTAISAARNIIARSTEHDFALFLAGASLIKNNYANLGTPVLLDALNAKCYKQAQAPFVYSNEACRLGMMLYILIDCGLKDNPEITTLAYLLSQQVEKDGNVWGTTQANLWGILGLSAYSSINPISDFTVMLSNNGVTKELKSNSILNVAYKKPITIKNTSDKQIIVESILTGFPKEQPARSNGVHLTKEFFDQNGRKVTTASFGQLLTVRLTVECKEFIENLVIADLLPGGFEIEDSLLATRAISVSSALAQKYPNFDVKRFEKGDDVYLVFGDAFQGKSTFTYNVRAISKGSFIIPSTQAEAMYDAKINGVSDRLGLFIVK